MSVRDGKIKIPRFPQNPRDAQIICLFLGAVLISAFVGYKIGTQKAAPKEGGGRNNAILDSFSRVPQWKFDVDQNNRETKKGVWKFMDEDDNERSRHAIMGGVYIRNHAPPDAVILDIGCASGTLSDFVIPSQKYEGYDVGCEAIKRGQLKRPAVNLTCGDAATLTPSRALYDVIVFSEMLYFLDVRAAIEKYMVFLRPKTGFFIISLFKFLHLKNGKNGALKQDFARENITAIAHALLKPINKVEPRALIPKPARQVLHLRTYIPTPPFLTPLSYL